MYVKTNANGHEFMVALYEIMRDGNASPTVRV